MGQVVVVTGANRGIGREIVRQLAERGDTAVLSARDAGKAKAAADEVRADVGGAVTPLALDVGNETSVANAVEQVRARHSRVDVLINNAGINYDTWQRATTANLSYVRETLETNLFGAWRVTQAMLPLLRRSDHPRVVNVSSGAGSITEMRGGTPAYKISKVGLNALSRMLGDELRDEGILVNSAGPGWVATDMGGPSAGPVPEGAASVLWAADIGDDGPTGGFYRYGRPAAW